MKTNNFQIVVPFYNDEDSFDSFIEILKKIEADDNTFILLDNGSSTDKIEAIAQKGKEIIGSLYVLNRTLVLAVGLNMLQNL